MKLWHQITHITTGALHKDLDILRMEKSIVNDGVIIWFKCRKCGKVSGYEWNLFPHPKKEEGRE